MVFWRTSAAALCLALPWLTGCTSCCGTFDYSCPVPDLGCSCNDPCMRAGSVYAPGPTLASSETIIEGEPTPIESIEGSTTQPTPAPLRTSPVPMRPRAPQAVAARPPQR